MTGPEHYREAERLARLAGEAIVHEDKAETGFEGRIRALMAMAQVHATLALAAAILPVPLKAAPDTSWLNPTHGKSQP